MKTAFSTSFLSVLVMGIAPLAVAQDIDRDRTEVRGQALYEKIAVTSDGLGLGQARIVPIREARVEVFDSRNGEIVFTGETDSEGRFRVEVPLGAGYRVRVLSRSVRNDIVVADNTSSGRIYSVEAEIRSGRTIVLLALDDQRISGAFNLLEVMRSANEFLRSQIPGIEVPHLRMFWSPRNIAVRGKVLEGEIGSTFFDLNVGSAFVLGDRQTDSDEFDDSVILHEYAHLLADRFSRDDSQGGPHLPGDVLDPRVAWSEGWANFFASVVQGSATYRDSFGPGGRSVLEYHLEDTGVGQPGYWNETTVHSLLWDLVDRGEEFGDGAEIDLNAVWEAFSRLSDLSFVYLESFLDQLSELLPAEIPTIEQTARSHFVPFIAADDTPSFPRGITGVRSVTGEVDSWSSGRYNLAQAAHLYTLEVRGGAVSAELEITGLGPAGNPRANDLDLALMNSRGQIVAESREGVDGETERLSMFVPAGTYVLEVRSYRLDRKTGDRSFNSGAYRLTFLAP